MSPFLDQQHLQAVLIDVVRLCLWLLILAVIFLPLERLFALHPQKIFRKAIAVDLGYYFLSSLLPGVVLAVPLALVAWGCASRRPARPAGDDRDLAAGTAHPGRAGGRRDGILLGPSLDP